MNAIIISIAKKIKASFNQFYNFIWQGVDINGNAIFFKEAMQ